MHWLDWSGNGSYTDEAAFITALAGALTLLVTIYRMIRHTADRIEVIDNTLNHTNEPVGDDGPTLGQRVRQIDDRVDHIDAKLDGLIRSTADLSAAMLDHINEEARRVQRLEERVNDLDRRQA